MDKQGKISVIENAYSGIFYVVLINVTVTFNISATFLEFRWFSELITGCYLSALDFKTLFENLSNVSFCVMRKFAMDGMKFRVIDPSKVSSV